MGVLELDVEEPGNSRLQVQRRRREDDRPGRPAHREVAVHLLRRALLSGLACDIPAFSFFAEIHIIYYSRCDHIYSYPHLRAVSRVLLQFPQQAGEPHRALLEAFRIEVVPGVGHHHAVLLQSDIVLLRARRDDEQD